MIFISSDDNWAISGDGSWDRRFPVTQLSSMIIIYRLIKVINTRKNLIFLLTVQRLTIKNNKKGLREIKIGSNDTKVN